MAKLLEHNDKGIYCEVADVYIDPWKAVKKAFITHAHADHARPGSSEYVCVDASKNIIKHRLSTQNVSSIPFGETLSVNGVKFSFHPAGHIIGSAQIRVEYKGEVWVVSGDYKTEKDHLSGEFAPLKCNTFITECTFGLPVFNWRPQAEIFSDINEWWAKNYADKKISFVSAYSLGKAQRVISGLDASIGKIYCHAAVENINEIVRDSGFNIQKTFRLDPDVPRKELEGAMIVAPPGFMNSNFISKLKNVDLASASGWMNLRGARRRRSVDRGFVLSDHADWTGLLDTINATEAEKILVTHGYVNVFSKYLQEQGYDASILETEYEGDEVELESTADESV
ncbi:ligase-associated DNA damage response exonuclease [Portibacter lacus]|uniref:DNA ligase-associated DEXH box helicase n=1 Tax=Portibacter lacus TaxID=1099794 RepID=A0AA37WH46_9BACT|nr:ligase-associated DNA damage response exonuclease [Portibacter lacus]GLR18899.1 DNA ligase-associated DEXH box helicase [Portibacter lacus]